MKLDPAITLVVKRIAEEFKKLRQQISGEIGNLTTRINNLPTTAGTPGPPGEPGAPGAAGAPGAPGAPGVTSFNSVPITPSQSGTVNNWNPAGLASANVIRLTNAETVGISITGISAKSNGDFLFVINLSQYALQILFENAGSLSANRISGAIDYTSSQAGPKAIAPGQTAVFIYHTNGGLPTWLFMGNIGDGIWDIRQPPSNSTISGTGILSPSRKFTRVTSGGPSVKGVFALLDAATASTQFVWNEISAWNMTGGDLTIENEDAGTTAGQRIVTPSSSATTWPANNEAKFVYDSTVSRWRLVSSFGSAPSTPPESFPVSSWGSPVALSASGLSIPFTPPAPVMPAGRTVYTGMRVTFNDMVTADYTVGPTSNPLGNYELPLIHGWGISGATPDPFYFYTRSNLTGPVDPAGASFTSTVGISGSMIIPAAAFYPDGVTTLTFFDNSAGLGFMAPTVQNGGSFGVNMSTSVVLPGVNILIEYVYG